MKKMKKIIIIAGIWLMLGNSAHAMGNDITETLSLKKYALLLTELNKSESSSRRGYNQFTFPSIMRFSFKEALDSFYIGKHISNGDFLKNNFEDQKFSLKFIEQLIQIETQSSKPVIILFGMADGCPPCDEQWAYLESHYGESYQLVYVLVDFSQG